MAELFKNIYNAEFFSGFTRVLHDTVPGFDKTGFLAQIYDADWDSRELKQRMRHISTVLNNHLPGGYRSQVGTILQIITRLQNDGYKEDSIEYMFLPDFLEVYGLEDFDVAVGAFGEITKFTSCEFAVRPFILKYETQMVAQMLTWANHAHPSVRRLASEGSRPRLPWAMAIPSFKKDPAPILPILRALKNDVSETVRRSVANNLNDISKDNPDIVMALVKNWQGASAETDRMLKHASRSLLKQGGAEIMTLFGFGSVRNINIREFHILTPNVKIGEVLEFSFTLVNTSTVKSKLRLEYGLYYLKANGSLAKKVFKISEKDYEGRSTTMIRRKQSFKLITTRKFYPGKHQVSVIVNGTEFEVLDFYLLAA